MTDGSMLDRYKRQIEPIARDPERDRRAKDLAERFRRKIEEKTQSLEPSVLEFDPTVIQTIFDASKWYLPGTVSDVLQFEERKGRIKRQKAAVATSSTLSYAEKKQGMRALEQRLASAEQLEMLINGAFSYSIRSYEASKEDQDTMNKVSAVAISFLEIVRDARRFAKIRVIGESGKDRLDPFFA